jgi:WD40-like Beta Propeller Repeat
MGIKRGLLLALAAAYVLPATALAGPHFSGWTAAQKIDEIAGNSPDLNTPYLDGCPIFSPDGLSLYMASNRPRFAGDTRTDLDIWVARRATTSSPFGSPVNLGAPINSAADDFCPTPVRGGLFFVSRRATGEACGLGDIYFTRRDPTGGWLEPHHLACAPEGPNSALDEQGPSYVEAGEQELLYFSRSSASVPGDIYVTERVAGLFAPAAPVPELNDGAANDIQPSVRKDGLEVVFSSNRTGTLGGQDVWSATRESLEDPWSPPVNVGPAVNGIGNETRPSLSWKATRLLFGRAPGPEGMSDIYVSTRAKL